MKEQIKDKKIIDTPTIIAIWLVIIVILAVPLFSIMADNKEYRILEGSYSMKSYKEKKKSLSIACYHGEVVISVAGGAYNSGDEHYKARMRIDKNKPIEVSVIVRENGQNHMLSKSDEWAEQLKSGSSAVLETKGWALDLEKKLIKFEISDFTTSFEIATDECNVD